MFKAPHDNPYLLFVHSTLTYPIKSIPFKVPTSQRHPNILPISSLSARAGQYFLCTVTTLNCLPCGWLQVPSRFPSLHSAQLKALTPGLCSVIPSKKAEMTRLHCHTHHTFGCAKPQPSLLPDFSPHPSPRQPATGLESKQ